MSPKVTTLVADAERTDASASPSPTPPELKIELRRLLAAILVADFRASQEAPGPDSSEGTGAR